MSAARSVLLQLLETAFKDPKIKTECTKDLAPRIKNKTMNRAFDFFPNLLPTAQFNALYAKFKKTIASIPPADNISTLTDKNEVAVMEFEKEIIRIACEELIDKKNKTIKPEIITLLKWENYSTSIDAIDIVCAYVGNINGFLLLQSPDYNNANAGAISGMVNHVNENYRTWAATELNKLGFQYEVTQTESTPPLITMPTFKNAAIAVGVGVGIGMLSAFLYSRFFSQPADSKQTDNKTSATCPKEFSKH